MTKIASELINMLLSQLQWRSLNMKLCSKTTHSSSNLLCGVLSCLSIHKHYIKNKEHRRGKGHSFACSPITKESKQSKTSLYVSTSPLR